MIRKSYATKINGYIALTSVLVIAAVITVIGISIASLSVSEGQRALADKKSAETLDMLEGCIEDVLLMASEDASYCDSGSGPACDRILPQGTCIITVSKNGSDWTIQATMTIEGYTKSLLVAAVRTNRVTVTAWQEVD